MNIKIFSLNTEGRSKILLIPVFSFLILVIALVTIAHGETYQATVIPWSGYWWPFDRGGLGTGMDYRGRPAPLEKYNLFTNGDTSGRALDYYMDHYYDADAPDWFGLCINWAWAACTENLDIWPSSEDNIIFRVGDKKGLLTLAHFQDVIRMGNGDKPEEFHYWLLDYIREQGKAFVADLATGEEVWSYPIFKYDMEITGGGNVQSVWVKAYFVSDSVPPDYMGSRIGEINYTYDLYLDGDGAITGGKWTGLSVNNHPELLTMPLGVSSFPGLDYQTVLELARSRDDFLERGSKSVDIGPGIYNLTLLDKDVYSIPAKAGDVISLEITKALGSSQDFEAVVKNGNGWVVNYAIVDEENPLITQFVAEEPPYSISLAQADDYEDPNIYVIKLDMEKSFRQEIPYIPKSGEWSGFALTNPGLVTIENVTLTSRDTGGAPIRTLLGPLNMAPGEKRLFFFSDLSVPLHELDKAERLTLTADGEVSFLNLIGDGDDFLASIVQGNMRGSRLIIPDTADLLTPGTKMFGRVINESFDEDAWLSLQLYSSDGFLEMETLETVPAGGWLTINPGENPFDDMPKFGWIDVRSLGEQVLDGFQYFSSKTNGVEALFALPVTDTVRKIVPHISRAGYYITKVTLINPSDSYNSVVLHPALTEDGTTDDYQIRLAPKEKKILEIQGLFDNRVNHSILEVNSVYPLVGYYSYSAIGGKENAGYPLLDETDFKKTLHLPHYAGKSKGGSWWTGVVICNPSSDDQTVSMEPYDSEGNLMAESVQSIQLKAGAYDVFKVAQRFGQAVAANISFINFHAEGDSGVIAGFYLYGNDRNKNILAGANM